MIKYSNIVMDRCTSESDILREKAGKFEQLSMEERK